MFTGTPTHGRVALECPNDTSTFPLATLRSWDLTSPRSTPQWQKTYRMANQPGLNIPTVVASGDGNTLALMGVDSAYVVDGRTGRLMATGPTAGGGQLERLAVSPDARTLATIDYGGSVELVDTRTGKLRQTLTSSTGPANNPGFPGFPELAFSPDGNYLAVWDNPIGLEVWDLHTGASIAVFDGRTTAPPFTSFGNAVRVRPGPVQPVRRELQRHGQHRDRDRRARDLARRFVFVRANGYLVAYSVRLGTRRVHHRRPRSHDRRMGPVRRCGRALPPHLHAAPRRYASPLTLGAFGTLCAMSGRSPMIGHRVLVDGMMGSGKSTFARALAARTGLPVIHLDVHYWKPGWVRPSDDEWRERQRALLAGEAWIIDGNYNETLALRLERAETVVFLDTPWWLCASRAFVRGHSQARRRDARGLRGLDQPTLARRVGRRREDLAQPPFRT